MENPKDNSLRKRFTFGITGILLLITLPLYAWKVFTKSDYTDFEVYYRAAQRAHLQQWSEIYSLKDGASPFRYLPSWIPFFELFEGLPLPQARVLWYFLQFFFFGLGFYFLYRTILLCRKPRDRSHAAWVTCIGILFILRFCLDTFTIGQVSSLMFLGFCFGLYGWVLRRPLWSVSGIWIPTFLKIGPGFLLGVFLSSRKKELLKGFWGSLAFLAVFTAVPGLILALWSGSIQVVQQLWVQWANIVAQDSNYYDASHYGSQSLKSVLLRAAKYHWISTQTADQLYLGIVILLCLGISAFWILRKPKSLYGRGLFFTQGLFAYFWAMPETFKYSFTPLAIPVVLLFTSRSRGLFTPFALGFGALTLSLAGKDLVGDTLFFGSQHASIPFLATVFLGVAVFQKAWQESFPSPFARGLARALNLGQPQLGPWEKLPASETSLDVSVLYPLPLGKDDLLNPAFVQQTLLEFQKALEALNSSRFEILLIPYGDRMSEYHPVYRGVLAVQSQLPQLKILPFQKLHGRGSALREGFLNSRGKFIFISQVEQPCAVQFYEEAYRLLSAKTASPKTEGLHLVRANRRHEATRFKIPVKSLSQVYSRHRLGVTFNRWVRKIIPIQTTDILSGNLAFSRRLAWDVFSVQRSPDFLFELEVELTAIANQYPEKDLPIYLSLAAEKKAPRILFETLNIIRSLPILAWRYRKGYYGQTPEPTGITADDWGLSAGVNQGILELCRLGIVKRVSVMANCGHIESGLKELLSIPGVEIGLHFNLTHGRPLQKNAGFSTSLVEKTGWMVPSPGKFLLKWLNPMSDSNSNKNYVRAEFLSQIQKMKDLNIPIHYVDGHHHIHLVPGLIDTLADLIQAAGIRQVRLPYDPTLWRSSKVPIVILSLWARKKLKKNGFQSLPCVYPHTKDFFDQGKLRARLGQNPNAEVIVHPAAVNDLHLLEVPDSYTNERITEYQALRILAKIRCDL